MLWVSAVVVIAFALLLAFTLYGEVLLVAGMSLLVAGALRRRAASR